MVRLDIETFGRTIAEGTSVEKRELLEMWLQDMDGWDIFPVKVVLPGLHDADAQVRMLTIKILGNLSLYDKLGREVLLALWRMIVDPDDAVRGALIEEIQARQYCVLHRDDLDELVPLLRNRDSGIRGSAMHLFLQIQHYFDDELCLKIAESAARENLDIQATIAEFLECLGQGCLLESVRDDDAGY